MVCLFLLILVGLFLSLFVGVELLVTLDDLKTRVDSVAVNLDTFITKCVAMDAVTHFSPEDQQKLDDVVNALAAIDSRLIKLNEPPPPVV